MIASRIDLWENRKYNGELEDGFRPMMSTFIRAGEKKRGMVLIFPGGGYGQTSGREAEPIAMMFANAGYHAAFVDYSVAPRKHPQPLMDAARALTIIKENAEEWQVNMDEIYVCGFSAGGHLCASISNLHRAQWLNDYDGIDAKDINIKGSILCYPVIVYGEYMHKGSFDNLIGKDATVNEYMSMSMEKHVNEKTPPTFIWHTVEDGSVPVENALIYVQALRDHKRPFEMHIYPNGRHGLALANEETSFKEGDVIPHVAGWANQCLEWMESL